jgi:hypothetical protein
MAPMQPCIDKHMELYRNFCYKNMFLTFHKMSLLYLGACYGLKSLLPANLPSNSNTEIFVFNMVVFGDEAF